MTPAPATVSLPTPRSYKRGPKSAERAAVLEAPAAEHQVSIELLLARVTIKGVAGVSSAAVAEYVAILRGDLANAARLARLNAETLVPPASIEAAVLDVCEDPEEHDPSCTDPCCVPEDEDDFAAYCVDEGSHLLADPSGLYGVRGVL